MKGVRDSSAGGGVDGVRVGTVAFQLTVSAGGAGERTKYGVQFDLKIPILKLAILMILF
jgi:hypothetical protein